MRSWRQQVQIRADAWSSGRCTNKSSSAEDQRSWSTGVASKPAPFHAQKDHTVSRSPPLLYFSSSADAETRRCVSPCLPLNVRPPPPLHRHEESLFTGTICPINVRSQQTVLPLISLLDLNEGRSLTNCCLETQQDASIMGFIQKPARPSSHPSCPLFQSYSCKSAKEFSAICFCVHVLRVKDEFYIPAESFCFFSIL